MNKESRIKEKKGIFAYVPLPALVLFGVAVLALLTDIFSRFSVGFADFVSNTIGRFIRAAFSYATYIFPFSVAEMMLWFSPVILFTVIYLAVKCAKRSIKSFSRFASGLLALVTLVYSLFTFSIGATYYGTKVAQKMGIDRRAVSAEELYETAKLILAGASAELDKIVYPEGTYSAMPYSYDKMNEKLNAAFAKVCEKYDGIDSLVSRTKPVILSPYWTYTHISGMYTFFTGEANVNTNYPDYVMVSSAAHEMAHQRGVVSEDEANFIAFVVCTSSDDPFLRYAGYLDVYQNVASSLASASSELYAKLWEEVPNEISGDLHAYAEFFEKYRENVAADVTESVNNAYIENHNQPAGVKSYGMVVDLVVSYMLYED
ncbi:MAG: DUF3810 domain-containing protein [Clostridia bacterium]|nr:DUF3810 domain-containing protein [Clostridia bacterium]